MCSSTAQPCVSWARQVNASLILPAPLARSPLHRPGQCREAPVVQSSLPAICSPNWVPYKCSQQFLPEQVPLTRLRAWPAVANSLFPFSWQSCYFSNCSWASSKTAEWLERSWKDTRKTDPITLCHSKQSPPGWQKVESSWRQKPTDSGLEP